MTKETGGPAFPAEGFVTLIDESRERVFHPGMTLREHAAIELRVPLSGTDWLDKMIIESQREELAGQALQGIVMAKEGDSGSDISEIDEADGVAILAYSVADAMIKARGEQ